MSVYELPSLFGLFLKALLLVYAFKSPTKTPLTRLFMAMLVVLSVFNVVELLGLRIRDLYGFVPIIQYFGYSYFLLFVAFIAIFLHISIWISTSSRLVKSWPGAFLIYLPASLLAALISLSDKVVVGFVPDRHTALRVPGDWYFLFEAFAITYFLAAVTYLVYGAVWGRSAMHRTRNRLWIFGLAPTAALTVYLIIARHFGSTEITATTYTPFTVTFFLMVAAYATHEYRLFDIEFYIPWSKLRKRKTAFYGRVRSIVAEIADLESVDAAIKRLGDALGCPVALVSTNRPTFATAGNSSVGAPPLEILRKFDHIVVASEIADARPDVHAEMKRHRIGAIVPFHPYSQHGSGWLLLGENFSEQVYTRRDFRVMEELFDKMADLFLDKLLEMRTQLAEAAQKISVLERDRVELQGHVLALRSEVQLLQGENQRLALEQRADSVAPDAGRLAESTRSIKLTLIGRDKAVAKLLREQFPQTDTYTSLGSSGFKRQVLPEVLVVHLESDAREQGRLARLLAENREQAVLLMGPGARDFVQNAKRDLLGALLEVLPNDATREVIARRVQALAKLSRSIYSLDDWEQPLMGESLVFSEIMAEAERLAGLVDPLLLRTADFGQALAVGAYIHRRARLKGRFVVLSDEALGEVEDVSLLITETLKRAEGGTLMLPDVGELPRTFAAELLQALSGAPGVRVIAACSSLLEQGAADLLAPLRPFALELPGLRERRADLHLLAHYFTLQFNLQAGTDTYLKQMQLDELMASDYPESVGALRYAVFNLLRAPLPAAPETAEIGKRLSDKTLEEHLAEYEARILSNTLERCEGNKSRAARMLGLRPNTLHYKLERYGLLRKN